ncbi:MAG: biotin/lipoyl-binding protein [Desulfobacterales bacterium]|nr:biotin/lipoyl-binding protein [Desulfobacterales bacterium]
MEYQLDINGTAVTTDLKPAKGNRAEAAVGEKIYGFEYQRISDTCIQLRVNGRQINAWVTPGKGGKTIILKGRHFFVRDTNERDGDTPASSGTGEAPSVVTPPMPAIVIQVPVARGDRVEKGDTLVVVSAMKMETALAAPHDGVVTRVGVAEGDKVMPGEILVDVDPKSQEEK